MKLGASVPALPTTPLVLLCFALALLGFPLWDHADSWSVLLFVLSLAVRVFLNWRGLPLPSVWTKLGFLAVVMAIALAASGTFVSLETAFDFLLLLNGLKVIESNNSRDVQVLTLLGMFLGLCDLFFDQDLARWLYVGFAYGLVLTARILFYQPTSPGAFRRSLWQATRLLAQALPLTLVFFLFFPRTSGDFRFFLGGSLMGAPGLTDRLSPGSLASLAERNDTAFCVGFPDGNPPPNSQLYWRGIVLWECTGLNWDRGAPATYYPTLGGPKIRQKIILEPYGDQWLFALDRPVGPVANSYLEAGGILRSQRHIFTRLAYDVVSQPENRQTDLRQDERQAAMRLPSHYSEKVARLAESWAAGAKDSREIVERGLQYFRTHGFTYSLSPGVYASAELDEFLFQRKVGFCEHYAASFATLMRLAKVPSRVVIGYQGGELNEVGNYYRVRQSDAHAWCEVWLERQGWLRVDPTSVIAPDRVNAGFQSFLEARAGELELRAPTPSSAALAWRDTMRRMHFFWDNLSYQWNLRVLSFDYDNQISFLNWLGWARSTTAQLALGVALTTILMLAALLFWLRRVPAAAWGDPARRWYARYCKRLARAGVVRKATEGPLDFARRAASELPEHAPPLLKVGNLYARLRYSSSPPPLTEFVAAIRSVPKLPRPAATVHPA